MVRAEEKVSKDKYLFHGLRINVQKCFMAQMAFAIGPWQRIDWIVAYGKEVWVVCDDVNMSNMDSVFLEFGRDM